MCVYFTLLGFTGKLKWEDNWVSYLDTMLQFSILSLPTRNLYLPTRFQYVHIKPEIHKNSVNISKGENGDNETDTSGDNVRQSIHLSIVRHSEIYIA